MIAFLARSFPRRPGGRRAAVGPSSRVAAWAALPIKSVVNAVERAVPAPQIETIIKRRRWFWLSPWLVAWPPLLVPQSEVRRLANQSANQPTTSAREITSGIRRRQVIPILSRIFRRDPLARDLPRLHSGLGEPAAGASPRQEAGGFATGTFFSPGPPPQLTGGIENALYGSWGNLPFRQPPAV